MAFTSTKAQQLALPILAASGLLSLAAITLFAANKKSPPQSRRIIPSPRTTLLPRLNKEQVFRPPHPPDIFPGSRDVTTLYGTMRIYELGPESGRKVMFLHGDATPSPLSESDVESKDRDTTSWGAFNQIGHGSSPPANSYWDGEGDSFETQRVEPSIDIDAKMPLDIVGLTNHVLDSAAGNTLGLQGSSHTSAEAETLATLTTQRS